MGENVVEKMDGDEAENLQQAANLRGTEEQRLKVLQAVVEQLPYISKVNNVENVVPRLLAIEEEKIDFKFRFQGKIPSNPDEFMNAIKTKVASTSPNAEVPQIEIKAGNNVEKYHKGYRWKQTFAVPTFYVNFTSSRKSIAEMIQHNVKEHQLNLPQEKYYLVHNPCEICYYSFDDGAEYEQRLFTCNPLHMCCKRCVTNMPNQRCHNCREAITMERRLQDDVWKALQETVFLPWKFCTELSAAASQAVSILGNLEVNYTLKDIFLLIGRYALIPELFIMLLNFSIGPIISGWQYYVWMFAGIYLNNFIKGFTNQRIFLNDVQLFIFLNQGDSFPLVPFFDDVLTEVGYVQNQIIIATAAFLIATLFRKVHEHRWAQGVWAMIFISHYWYNHWTSKLLGIGVWECLNRHAHIPLLPYGYIGFDEKTPIKIIALGFALFVLYLFKKIL